ncbi:MAG: ABC transporter ATP-binding protein [Deltaproteobacteria bacterium]|jgi:branched-chain amino acid transport system ATP-binding protein|nr:ABC transporter ATP-binding protein [Deltaproteobacteria bacterium]
MSEPLLTTAALCRMFGGLTALCNLDMAVERNAILGLIGPNGSGKTTFFNVITGIYPVTSGKVSFEDRDVTNFSPQAVYRAGIARTFQRSRLWLPLSIFDNVILGDRRHIHDGLVDNLFRRRRLKAQFEEGLERTRELLAIFDPGLADNPFEPVANLPMISRRRIEICRALISGPKLLLLDEPSAGMTHEETFSLVDDILEIKQRVEDLTIIIIEHEMSVIERITHRCVVLNFGQKICEGTYEEVTADPQVQQAYLGVD